MRINDKAILLADTRRVNAIIDAIWDDMSTEVVHRIAFPDHCSGPDLIEVLVGGQMWLVSDRSQGSNAIFFRDGREIHVAHRGLYLECARHSIDSILLLAETLKLEARDADQSAESHRGWAFCCSPGVAGPAWLALARECRERALRLRSWYLEWSNGECLNLALVDEKQIRIDLRNYGTPERIVAC